MDIDGSFDVSVERAAWGDISLRLSRHDLRVDLDPAEAARVCHDIWTPPRCRGAFSCVVVIADRPWVTESLVRPWARPIWLSTTNDNTRALRFYQRCGDDLFALDRDAVTRVQATLEPTVPLTVDGIAVRHELRLEKVLHAS